MRHMINWIEIPVVDLDRARAFYQAILDVELQVMNIGPINYAMFPTEDRFNAGALAQGEGYIPSASGIAVYLDGGNDLDIILRRVAPAGGKVILAKTYFGPEAGFSALFIDTEGNRIGLQNMGQP